MVQITSSATAVLCKSSDPCSISCPVGGTGTVSKKLANQFSVGILNARLRRFKLSSPPQVLKVGGLSPGELIYVVFVAFVAFTFKFGKLVEFALGGVVINSFW